jgi:hypothetical protein
VKCSVVERNGSMQTDVLEWLYFRGDSQSCPVAFKQNQTDVNG